MPLLGNIFLADCSPQTAELHLVEISPSRNFAQLDRPPFILIFRSAPEVLLVSGSYALRSDGFGPDLIDIIQIASPAAGTPGHYYQAVFN